MLQDFRIFSIMWCGLWGVPEPANLPQNLQKPKNPEAKHTKPVAELLDEKFEFLPVFLQFFRLANLPRCFKHPKSHFSITINYTNYITWKTRKATDFYRKPEL